ncbi:MAG: hypothetical protein OXH30_15040, partial [Chloroflexi bacterium]|nr:hypothetical protein [Chloroflexota bacterium]
ADNHRLLAGLLFFLPGLLPMKVIFEAARNAGALGVFLSGSGSTILALTQERSMTVAYEMFDAARLAGVDGRVEVTRPTGQGAHVVSVSES